MEENKEKNENQEETEETLSQEENQTNEAIEVSEEEQESAKSSPTENTQAVEESSQKQTESKVQLQEDVQEKKTGKRARFAKFLKKHYKKILSGFMALILLSLVCVFIFYGCMAPKIENIYDRMVYLLESSQEVNALIYGCGLPVWEDDSEYVNFRNIYYGLDTARNYEIVMPNAKYSSVQQMKEAIEKIYSREYIDEVLYPAAFDGFAISDNNGGSVIAVARYYEEGMYLWQTKEFRVKPYTGMRIYDYSTMKVRSLGKRDRCIVTIDSWLEDTPDQVETIEILIALQDGQWYLDNFVV